MKSKLEIAHEWYLKHSESCSFMDSEVKMAWDYADKMQAEADKRKVSGVPDVIRENSCVRGSTNTAKPFLKNKDKRP